MLVLWNLSLVFSIIAFMVGMAKRSSIALLMSTLTSLPIAFYFLGAENAWRLVGFMPFALLILTVFIWLLNKKTFFKA